MHEIAIFYLMRFPEHSPIYQQEFGEGNEEIVGEKTYKIRYRWFPIEKLSAISMQPSFLKKALKNLPEHPEHLIFKEL